MIGEYVHTGRHLVDSESKPWICIVSVLEVFEVHEYGNELAVDGVTAATRMT